MNSRLFIVFIVLLAFSSGVAGQQTPDSSFRQKAVVNLIQSYFSTIGLQAHLYNGPLYEIYPTTFTSGHQYFKTDLFENGSVSYDGLLYNNVLLRLDIIREELVMLHPVSKHDVVLIKEKVDSFSFLGFSFINIKNDSSGMGPVPGFYEQLFSSGEIKFLAKRVKYIQETSSQSGIVSKVHDRNHYFMMRNGIVHRITNKNSLINLLKDKRNEMQGFIKNNNLRFKGNFEGDAIKTLRYYGQR